MKRKVFIIIVSIILVITIIGFSFGYLKLEHRSTNNQTITLSNINIQVLTDMTAITMNSALPVSDTEGLSGTPTTFQIKNNGAVPATYRLILADAELPQGKTRMDNKDVRYRLKRTQNSVTTTLEIQNLDSLGLIDTGTIAVNEIISFELVCWIDYNANPNNQAFSKVILVEGLQLESLDTSGANFPELTDNMIPVYYSQTSNTEGVWKKADSTNKNSTYKWFNYSEQMWANVVTVKENGTQTRDYYLNAAPGTTIAMDDITTMWVWIPRYKYEIFNGNNETAEEQMINVYFEHGNETTGTVRCHDDILTAEDSNHSEICTDTTNNGIKNKKSTYTHPAFTFGSEELTGFWMSKFQMSTDDATCNETPNDENCNKTGLNILVKPDEDTFRYEIMSTAFANIRRMESYGNIHGFKQNENATTFLDANNNLTGEISNDNNRIDIHMIKNMEWGAVAYLSQSKYGKQGNTSYTGNNKIIYINNNTNIKSGYSGGSYDSAASTTETYLYNNFTNGGPGASTTGTIYGIYDMSGGVFQMVMANYQQTFSDSTIWSVESQPLAKYFDVYSSSSATRYNNSQLRSKLGDGLREVLTVVGEVSGSWYGQDSYFLTSNWPILIRGGYYNYQARSGVFNNNVIKSTSIGATTSRPVLTVSRNMPWLDNNNNNNS